MNLFLLLAVVQGPGLRRPRQGGSCGAKVPRLGHLKLTELVFYCILWTNNLSTSSKYTVETGICISLVNMCEELLKMGIVIAKNLKYKNDC
jgi:hypothetical protein